MDISFWFWGAGILFGIISTLATYLFRALNKNLNQRLDELSTKIDRVEAESAKVERRFMEYQISAPYTFVLKEDFKDFKKEK